MKVQCSSFPFRYSLSIIWEICNHITTYPLNWLLGLHEYFTSNHPLNRLFSYWSLLFEASLQSCLILRNILSLFVWHEVNMGEAIIEESLNVNSYLFNPTSLYLFEKGTDPTVPCWISCCSSHDLLQPRPNIRVGLRIAHMSSTLNKSNCVLTSVFDILIRFHLINLPCFFGRPILKQQHRVLNRHTPVKHSIHQQQSTTLLMDNPILDQAVFLLALLEQLFPGRIPILR